MRYSSSTVNHAQGGPHRNSVLLKRLLWKNNSLLLDITESKRDFQIKSSSTTGALEMDIILVLAHNLL